jgi:hypothetical protein
MNWKDLLLILLVVLAGVALYDKAIKPMLEPKKES